MSARHRLRAASRRWAASAAVAAVFTLAAASGQERSGQEPPAPTTVNIPQSGTLEGLPRVRIDSTAESTTRHVLDKVEAARNPLRIRVQDGRLYWASREDKLLQLQSSGPFTYLSSEPGSYIRLTRLNDRIAYVEHVDLRERGSVTWWGELRIVVGP